jgi:hypothetical protein
MIFVAGDFSWMAVIASAASIPGIRRSKKGQLGAMNDYPLDCIWPTTRLRPDLEAGLLVDGGDQTFAHDRVIVGDENGNGTRRLHCSLF